MAIKEEKTRCVSIIAKDIEKELVKLAKKEGRSKSNMVAKIIEDYVNANKIIE